jgi:hypothetical protein
VVPLEGRKAGRRFRGLPCPERRSGVGCRVVFSRNPYLSSGFLAQVRGVTPESADFTDLPP